MVKEVLPQRYQVPLSVWALCWDFFMVYCTHRWCNFDFRSWAVAHWTENWTLVVQWYSIIETSLNLLVQSNSSDSYSCDTAHQHKCLQYSNETCQEYSRCVGAQFYSWRCLSKNMSHVCWYCTRKNKNVRTVYLHVWDMDRSRTLPRGYDTVMKLMQTHTRAVRRKSSYGGWLQSR